MLKLLPEIGEQYNYLTVLSDLGTRNGRMRVQCRCDCGTIKEYALGSLKSGNTKSCGCKKGHLVGVSHYVHGLVYHPLYHKWNGIKMRCYSLKYKSYHTYGGRGIKVCDEWLNNFMAFYDWSIANGWQDGLQIDRINNDGNYEPGNCRYVTREVNQRNTTRTRWVTINGERKILADWARVYNMTSSALSTRLKNKSIV